MDLLEWLIEKFNDMISGLLSALPKSPIVYLTSNSTISNVLSYLNWFIPVYLWISLLEAWLIAIATYYIYQVVLRWIKVIE